MTVKTIPNADALKIVEESIKEGRSVRLTVRGNSMSPQLLDGVDVVTLYPFDPQKLKTGDVIFFRHKEGFILHRIVRIYRKDVEVSGDQRNREGQLWFFTKGDALSKTETVNVADVVAVAQVPEHSKLRILCRRIYLLVKRYGSAVLRRCRIS